MKLHAKCGGLKQYGERQVDMYKLSQYKPM